MTYIPHTASIESILCDDGKKDVNSKLGEEIYVRCNIHTSRLFDFCVPNKFALTELNLVMCLNFRKRSCQLTQSNMELANSASCISGLQIAKGHDVEILFLSTGT